MGKMVLTKESVDAIRLTRRHRECYAAREVDTVLDEIAAAADEQYRELEQLRSMKHQIADVLLSAQQTAEKMMEEARSKCNAELGALQQRKIMLQHEIASLERYKALELERIRNDLEKLLVDRKPFEAAPLHAAAAGK